ncbi:hypothetical protein Tco_0673743 [Tanacetum coccineum]
MSKKDNKSLKRTTRISVRACCLVNPPPTSPPYQRFSPPSDYQTAPPSTPLESPPTTPIAPPGFSLGQLLTIPKTTLSPLTSPPPAPTQPSKQSSPLAINIEHVELIFFTPPTSPHPFLTLSNISLHGPSILHLLNPCSTPWNGWQHMTGNLKLLCNFMEKFLGTVRFGNDQFAPILGYGDLIQGNVTIKRVYYVEGLNHNLFSVGQFCDADLEVAFRKSTCFVRDL